MNGFASDFAIVAMAVAIMSCLAVISLLFRYAARRKNNQPSSLAPKQFSKNKIEIAITIIDVCIFLTGITVFFLVVF